MPRVKHNKSADLIAGLNKARDIGDVAEMWRCAGELMVMDRDRPAKRGMPKASADEPTPRRGQR
jgi:hypothetical protein